MHLSLKRSFALLSFVISFAPVYAQKPGGFSDFDDEIILEDKKKSNKDLDFLDQNKPQKELPKKQVNEDELLNNLQKESDKIKKTEKKETKSITRKKVIEDSDETTKSNKKQQRLENLPEEEKALLEEEQDQEDIVQDEKKKEKPKETEQPKEIEQQAEEKPIESPQAKEKPQDDLTPAPIEPEEELEEGGKEEPAVVEAPSQEEEPYDIKDVDVERSVYENKPQKKCNCKYDYLTPYAQRRGSWSNTLSLGYNTYHPTNYQPNFVTTDFETEYGQNSSGVDLSFGFKKNMAIGAITLDIGLNYVGAPGMSGDTFNLITGTAALYYYIDNIWNEPYVVPYGVIGAGYAYYEETIQQNRVYGATTVTYLGGGLMFQLDWMDDLANLSSYEEEGIENTFLYIEGRAYPDIKAGPSTQASPDLSSVKLAYLAGLKFEF